MKTYHLKRQQFLPININQAWEFFSTPTNLSKITPEHMKFKILYTSGGNRAYSGQIIHYHVNVLPGIRMNWVTEISQVQEPFYFIDEQRFGPYRFWHHQHHFIEVPGGVEMTDELTYVMPFGWLGRLANFIFVGREVNRIFDFRTKVLNDLFSLK